MRRMYSLKQLEEVANKQVQEQVSSGQLKNVKVFEEIVDKDGHQRFVEGDVDLIDEAVPTKVYGKWSLSGSHLLIVLCLSGKNGNVIPSGSITKNIDLPEWILDKITPLGLTAVSKINVNWFDNTNSAQTTSSTLEKKLDGSVSIYLTAITLNADRNCRVEYDLLIDNE